MDSINGPTKIKTILAVHGVPLYLAGASQVDAAGCWLHFDYLARKMNIREGRGASPQHFLLAAVPEPTNPFDPNAVALSLDNHHVGYLPAAEAKVYAPVLASHIAKGFVPFVRGTLSGQSSAYIYVRLAMENVYRPQQIDVSRLPGAPEVSQAGAFLLDDSGHGYRGISTAAESGALQLLIAGTEGEYVLASLVLLPEKNGHRKRRVGIQWRGQTVARLSAISSNRYVEAMASAEASGQLLAARIRVPRWPRPEIVMVFIQREFDLDDDGLVVADSDFLSPRRQAPFGVEIDIDNYGSGRVSVVFETVHQERPKYARSKSCLS